MPGFALLILLEIFIFVLFLNFSIRIIREGKLEKNRWIKLLYFVHFFSVLLIINQTIFEVYGVIIKPLLFIPGIGLIFYLISMIGILIYTLDCKGNKWFLIYLNTFFGLNLIINCILLFYPMASLLKFLFILIYLVHPIRYYTEIDQQKYIDGGSLMTQGKTEIIDRGWYYEKGNFYEFEEDIDGFNE